MIDHFTLEATPSSGILLFEEDRRPALAYLDKNNLCVWSPGAKSGRCVQLRDFPTDCVNRPGLGMVADLDGDSIADFWIVWSEAGGSLRQNFWKCTALVAPYNRAGFRLKTRLSVPGFRHRADPNREDATHLSPLKLLAKGASGRPEVLARTYTSWGTDYAPDWNVFPRGLVCFGARGGGLLWSNALACSSGQLAFADLNEDGQEEILLGTTAPDNGFKLSDGTDDSHRYLSVFNSTGGLLWSRVLSDELTDVTPVIPKRPTPGEPRVYAWVRGGHFHRWNSSQKAEVGRIVAFDNQGKELNQRDFRTSLRSFISADLDGDGKEELLASDRFGRIHVLDSKLNVLGTPQIVDTNGAHFVHSINLDEVRTCTNLVGHWDYTRAGSESGPPAGQTNNCQNLKAHGFTNVADVARLEFIGLGKMRRSGPPLLVLYSCVEVHQTETGDWKRFEQNRQVLLSQHQAANPGQQTSSRRELPG